MSLAKFLYLHAVTNAQRDGAGLVAAQARYTPLVIARKDFGFGMAKAVAVANLEHRQTRMYGIEEGAGR